MTEVDSDEEFERWQSKAEQIEYEDSDDEEFERWQKTQDASAAPAECQETSAPAECQETSAPAQYQREVDAKTMPSPEDVIAAAFKAGIDLTDTEALISFTRVFASPEAQVEESTACLVEEVEVDAFDAASASSASFDLLGAEPWSYSPTTLELHIVELQIAKGRCLAADGPCYAKVKFRGRKYKTPDADLVEVEHTGRLRLSHEMSEAITNITKASSCSYECSWDCKLNILMMSPAEADNLCIEVYQRRRMSGNKLVGSGFFRDSKEKILAQERTLGLWDADAESQGAITLASKMHKGFMVAEQKEQELPKTLQLTISEGRKLADTVAGGMCYAKLKHQGCKYKTADVQTVQMHHAHSSASGAPTKTVADVMAAATEAGIDMNNTQELIAFTKKYRESQIAAAKASHGALSLTHNHRCSWNATFSIPLLSAADAEGLCIEVYERRSVTGSTLLGRGHLRDVAAAVGTECWLELLVPNASYTHNFAGEISVEYSLQSVSESLPAEAEKTEKTETLPVAAKAEKSEPIPVAANAEQAEQAYVDALTSGDETRVKQAEADLKLYQKQHMEQHDDAWVKRELVALKAELESVWN